MPEGIEVEYYRRAALVAVGRTISDVVAEDAWYLKRETDAHRLRERLVGSHFASARRTGKLLLLPIAAGGCLGLRFGMTGRLIVDGSAVIDRLEYSSPRDEPDWDRFVVRFDDGGWMAMRDPRRLGGVELDPQVEELGVDLYDVSGRDLTSILSGSDRALKARLMDQSQIAGLGNLLTDEILWRASLHPARAANSLTATERRRLLHHLQRVVVQLTERGGSHTGDLQEHRREGALCPRDSGPIVRHAIGGRTTYACSVHQAGPTAETAS